ALAFLLMGPRSAINEVNAAKIKEGMSVREAEVIFGGPARDESTAPALAIVSTKLAGTGEVLDDEEGILWFAFMQDLARSSNWSLFWISDEAVARIDLDQDGRVREHECSR